MLPKHVRHFTQHCTKRLAPTLFGLDLKIELSRRITKKRARTREAKAMVPGWYRKAREIEVVTGRCGVWPRLEFEKYQIVADEDRMKFVVPFICSRIHRPVKAATAKRTMVRVSGIRVAKGYPLSLKLNKRVQDGRAHGVDECQ